MITEVEALLDKKVRPLFANHGGGIQVVSLDKGILKVKMIGACSQCMSASADVEEIVEKEIKTEFPDIKEVVLVTGVSENLLASAREFLRGK
ncbi:MAG: NifU family protein [Proteocatella sp.]